MGWLPHGLRNEVGKCGAAFGQTQMPGLAEKCSKKDEQERETGQEDATTIHQEEFIDDAGVGDTDSTPGCPGLMGRDDDADPLACFAQDLFRTVVERAADPTFRMRQVLEEGSLLRSAVTLYNIVAQFVGCSRICFRNVARN